MARKILMIVDAQYDFCDPNGRLYVRGAETLVDRIIEHMKNNDYGKVILTVDWHPHNHCSFKAQGGEWPAHCVQFTQGAAIDNKLIHYLIDNKIEFNIFKKGTKHGAEEYGAFEKGYNENGDLYLCGVAGDYCVYETWKNLKGRNVTPLYDLIPFIGEPFKYEEK